VDGWLPILFLAVILKIPVFAGMYIVWYAVKAEPETEEEPGEHETDHGFRRWRRAPTPPRKPRRGPHGGGAVAVAEPRRQQAIHAGRDLHRRHPTPRSR
jgi:hypothetical protein